MSRRSHFVVAWLLSATATVASSAQTPATRATTPEAFGVDIPDVSVSDQDGRVFRFRSELMKGRTVVVNFMFTTCTTVCPALTTTMRGIQRALGDRVGRDVQLVSISVDPAVDRPDRLRAFATSFGAGPGWTFVTGDKTEIDRLLKAFGSYGGDITAHSTTMLIGNERTGRWIRTNGLAPLSTNLPLIVSTAEPTSSAGEGAR